MRTKSLMNEIETLCDERNEALDSAEAGGAASAAAPTAGHAPKGGNASTKNSAPGPFGLVVSPPVPPGPVPTSGPHITLQYNNRTIFADAAGLLVHHVKRQTGMFMSQGKRT